MRDASIAKSGFRFFGAVLGLVVLPGTTARAVDVPNPAAAVAPAGRDAAGNPATIDWLRALDLSAPAIPETEVAVPPGPGLDAAGPLAWGAVPFSPPGIPGRLGNVVLYDPSGTNPGLVVFGGYNGTYLGDVWRMGLDCPRQWEQLSFAGATPSARTTPCAAYDSHRRRVLVFGGFDGTNYLNDVWALSLDGTPTWMPLSPAGVAPSARTAACAVYDPIGDRFVVFGGATGSGYRNDAWALSLDGDGLWQQLTPTGTPPSGRQYAGAAWDAARSRMLIFGGYTGTSLAGDSWALSLSGPSAWSLVAPNNSGPVARTAAGTAYDPTPPDRLIVFGGSTVQGSKNDVWALALGNGAWSPLTPGGTKPAPRWGPGLVYDQANDRWLAYGGYGAQYLTDTWRLHSSAHPAGILVSFSVGLTTSECGDAASFSVILTSPPLDDVVIGLSSSNTGEGTVDRSSLTFTSGTWNVPQWVTVTGVDDAAIDGEVSYEVVTTLACSKDPSYDGLSVSDVALANADNDCTPRWPYPLSYVDFSGFNRTLPPPHPVPVGFELGIASDGCSPVFLDETGGNCWYLTGQSLPVGGRCQLESSLSFWPTEACDNAFKVTLSLTNGINALAFANHIVVKDYPLLSQADLAVPNWGGYGNLLGFVRAYAPVLKFHQGEPYVPVCPEVILHGATMRSDGPLHPEPTPPNLTGPLTPEDLAKYSWSFFTIDEPSNPANPTDALQKYQAAYDAVEQTRDPSCIYATAIRIPGASGGDRIIVQYWMNYYFNDYWPCDLPLAEDWHECDWERVAIAFDTTLRPLQMAYKSHANSTRMWDSETGPGPYVEKWQGTTSHPVVYVSRGAHGNFESSGHLACEGHDGLGREFVPGPQQVELLPRWSDLSDGASGNGWIKYSGYWGTSWVRGGYYDEFGIDGEPLATPVSACWRGPAFRRDWSDPVGELFENLTVVARGPVDMVVTDPAGRTCKQNGSEMPTGRYEVRRVSPGDDHAADEVAVIIPYPDAGEYRVSVAGRKTGGSLDSGSGTFSLLTTRQRFGKPSDTVVLAENVSIVDVPPNGFRIVPDIPHVGVSSVEPVVWSGDWTPDDSSTVEWRLTPGKDKFDVRELVLGTLRLNGTVMPASPIRVEGDTLVARFPRGPAIQSIGNSGAGTTRRVVLTGFFADSLLRLESPATVDVVKVTSVEARGDGPSLFDVGTPRPNPGKGLFELPVEITDRGGLLHASVVDVKGRSVATLADGVFTAGRHSILWKGVDRHGFAVPAGTYWIVVTFEGQRRSAKVSVLP
jgi:hypothetical protein